MAAIRLFGRPLPIHFALLGRKRKYIKSKTTAKLTEKRTSIATVRDILWTFGTFPTPLLSRYRQPLKTETLFWQWIGLLQLNVYWGDVNFLNCKINLCECSNRWKNWSEIRHSVQNMQLAVFLRVYRSSGKECKKWCWNEGKSIKRPVICPVAHSAVLITLGAGREKAWCYMGINLISFLLLMILGMLGIFCWYIISQTSLLYSKVQKFETFHP